MQRPTPPGVTPRGSGGGAAGGAAGNGAPGSGGGGPAVPHGNLFGALMSEAAMSGGRRHLREVEDKRQSMMPSAITDWREEIGKVVPVAPLVQSPTSAGPGSEAPSGSGDGAGVGESGSPSGEGELAPATKHSHIEHPIQPPTPRNKPVPAIPPRRGDRTDEAHSSSLPTTPTPTKHSNSPRGLKSHSNNDNSSTTNSNSTKDALSLTQSAPAGKHEKKLRALGLHHKKEKKSKSSASGGGSKLKRGDKRLRKMVIDEMLSTEADYVRDLKIIQTLYYAPLKERGIIEPQELQSIFLNVSIIVNVSVEVESELRKLQDSDLCGQTMLKIADFLKMYTQYCSTQDTSMRTLSQVEKKNKAFAQFLDDCMSNPISRGLSINAFLIKPVQRICKYPLLLRELMKYTPEDHQDYADIQAAFDKVSEVVEFVNKKRAEAEGLQTLLEIQRQVGGGDIKWLEPGRHFIREGPLTKVQAQGGKMMERYLFLCNDILVYVTSNTFGGSLKVQTSAIFFFISRCQHEFVF
eukprot:TRINITY_DN3304_c0_g1_i2.p1 TRINITY_DN3304_c0_g1~~TRINITY_DN3304_c0_g1_i2.p1  ORF type:complete len:521 (-),score=109.35 TRINITY_DN3304_c0_g1_i2:32-1594(-)